MPRRFYDDTNRRPTMGELPNLCGQTIELFDGPAYCTRENGHKVETMTRSNSPSGEFHQEEFEGWVWDNEGAIG